MPYSYREDKAWAVSSIRRDGRRCGQAVDKERGKVYEEKRKETVCPYFGHNNAVLGSFGRDAACAGGRDGD